MAAQGGRRLAVPGHPLQTKFAGGRGEPGSAGKIMFFWSLSKQACQKPSTTNQVENVYFLTLQADKQATYILQ
jgi:hypothetical protein